MDTRFWGPSGWRLLHLISFRKHPHAKHTQTFFQHLPYVLPCKFCRASLAEYYTDDPVPSEGFAEWLYRIHNRVNGKLRGQNLLHTEDPSWEEVRTRYETILRTPCSTREMIGWDFLFSIAYTTPCSAVATSPMPNAPPMSQLTTPELRNRWGVMSRKERLPYLHTFWKTLPNVLPIQQWQDTWKQVVSPPPNPEKGRRSVTEWLYKAERSMCRALQEASKHSSFTGLCSELNTFSSGCGKDRRRIVTCRAKRSKLRATLKHRHTHM